MTAGQNPRPVPTPNPAVARRPPTPAKPPVAKPPAAAKPPTPPRTTTVRRQMPEGVQRLDRFVDGRLVQSKELRRIAKPTGNRVSDRYRVDRFDLHKGLPKAYGDAFLRARFEKDLRVGGPDKFYSHSVQGTWNGGRGFRQFHPVSGIPPRRDLNRALSTGRWSGRFMR